MLPKTYHNKRIIWESRSSNIFTCIIYFLFPIGAIFVFDKISLLVLIITILLCGGGGAWTLYELLHPNILYVKPRSALARQILAEHAEELRLHPGLFEYDDTGFTINLPKESRHYQWNNILSIDALLQPYHDDRVMSEYIHLDFHFDNTSTLRISNSMSGWILFVIKMETNLPTVPSNWQAQLQQSQRMQFYR